MDKQLRLTAAKIVVDSKASKLSKLQMLSFIKEEASDAQIKALLMDGKIVHLDEQSEEIVNDRFEGHPLQEGTLKSILGMIMVTPVGWIQWRTIKAVFSEKQRRCGVYAVGYDRDACLLAARGEQAKRSIALIKKEAKNCKDAPNPEKCKKSVAKQIAKFDKVVKKVNDRMRKVSQKGHAGTIAAGKEKAKDPSAKII